MSGARCRPFGEAQDQLFARQPAEDDGERKERRGKSGKGLAGAGDKQNRDDQRGAGERQRSREGTGARDETHPVADPSDSRDRLLPTSAHGVRAARSSTRPATGARGARATTPALRPALLTRWKSGVSQPLPRVAPQAVQ